MLNGICFDCAYQQYNLLKMLTKLRLIITTRGMISRNSNQFRKTNPAELFKLIQQYSTNKIGSKQYLTHKDLEERAILAFYTYDFISHYQNDQFLANFRSLRQRIFRLEHLATSLLKKGESYNLNNWKKKQQNINIEESKMTREQIYRKLQEDGFSPKNIDKVIEAYDIKEGMTINTEVWRQQRFLQACNSNGKITLQPNAGTGQIFKKITSEVHQSCIISGDKGCGKSFAYLNYFYLSNFITDYRIYLHKNRWMKRSQRFEQLVDQNTFSNIKKLFYVPLKHISQPDALEEIFQHQTHIINRNSVAQMQISQLEKYGFIKKFLNRIRSYYSLAKVKTICVADEANVYLSVFRSLKFNSAEIINEVQSYSDLLNCLRYRFSLLVYNSSQAVEAQQLHDWSQTMRDKYGQNFHDIYSHDRSAKQNLHIAYSKFLFSRSGHIYLYTLLWDQMCKYIPQLESHLVFRNLFQEYFGLPSSQNTENSNKPILQWWQTDVKNLNIRKGCEKENDLLNKQLSILVKQAPQNILNFKNQLQVMFQQLKNKIIQSRQKIFLRMVSGYINKAQNKEIKAFRYTLLHKIKKDYKNTKFNKQDIPIIQVDFMPIIQQFQKINSTVDYKEQASKISFLLGCGQPIQVNSAQYIIKKQTNKTEQQAENSSQKNFLPTKFKFLINQQSLEQIMSILAQKQDDVIVVTNRILDLPNFQHDLVGNLLDTLYFLAFQYQTINLRVQQRTLLASKYKTFQVQKIFPFEVKTGRAKLIYEQQFKQIIEYAKSNQGISVLGFQANKVPTSQIQVGYKINARNPIFDFVIVTKMENYIFIESFDETLGQLTSKVTGFSSKFNQLSRQITNLNKYYKEKIIWKHRILAFDHLVDQYLKINHTQYKLFHSITKNGLRFPSAEQYAAFLANYNKALSQSKDSQVQSQITKMSVVSQATNNKDLSSSKDSQVSQKKKIDLPDMDLLNSKIGQISLQLSVIPNKDHFSLPQAKKASQDSIMSQIMKISSTLKKQKENLKK